MEDKVLCHKCTTNVRYIFGRDGTDHVRNEYIIPSHNITFYKETSIYDPSPKLFVYNSSSSHNYKTKEDIYLPKHFVDNVIKINEMQIECEKMKQTLINENFFK